jgi:hypothetical protein
MKGREEKEKTNLSSEMRLTEALVEPDLIPSFDEGDAEVGRNEVLCLALLLLHDVLSLDDLGDVFGDGSVRSWRKVVV